MCGIVLSIRLVEHNDHHTNTSHNAPSDEDTLFDSLVRATSDRGPDSQNTYRHLTRLDDTSSIEVKLSASVLGLRLRDNHIVSQPLIGKRGVLAWNGQVFQGLDIRDQNDTSIIFDKLESGADPSELLSSLEGP
jgi:asparagine synthetase B (glutamine-hydrolysing)